MSDEHDAELEYLRQREAELAADLRQQFGMSLDDLTPDLERAITQTTINALVAGGRHDLADAYVAALSRWQRDYARLNEVIATLRAKPRWTASDDDTLNAAKDASADAAEQFQRAQAQAKAFLNSPGGGSEPPTMKGGA